MFKFDELVREEFGFLEKEFGFAVRGISKDINSFHVIYVHDESGIGIKVLYEPKNACVFLFVYHLIDGGLCENPRPITDESTITCFDFADTLPEHERMKPLYAYGDNSVYSDGERGFRKYVSDFSEQLKEKGAALLTGDFAIIEKAETNIKQRARDYRQRQV